MIKQWTPKMTTKLYKRKEMQVYTFTKVYVNGQIDIYPDTIQQWQHPELKIGKFAFIKRGINPLVEGFSCMFFPFFKFHGTITTSGFKKNILEGFRLDKFFKLKKKKLR